MEEKHYAKVWERKNITDYVPGSNIRVETAAILLRSGKRLLDVGCGDGMMGTLVRNRFEEIYGVDISNKAVEMAKRRGIKAYKVNLNVEPLPFMNNYFDSITCLSVLQLVYDMIFVLKELNRVLKPDGDLILAVPNMRAFWRIFQLAVLGYFPRTSKDPEGFDGGTLHYLCYRNLKDLLEKARFKVMIHRGIFCIPRPVEKLPDRGWIGKLKAEFLSAEMLVRAVKVKSLEDAGEME